MATIAFTVLGVPKSQARHRHTSAGTSVRTYDPSAKEKQSFAQLAEEHAPAEPFTGPVEVSWVAVFPYRKGDFGTGRNAGVLKASAPKYHTARPDRDNIDKFILDALSGIFWRNDSQVCCGAVAKIYGLKPRLEIRVETM